MFSGCVIFSQKNVAFLVINTGCFWSLTVTGNAKSLYPFCICHLFLCQYTSQERISQSRISGLKDISNYNFNNYCRITLHRGGTKLHSYQKCLLPHPGKEYMITFFFNFWQYDSQFLKVVCLYSFVFFWLEMWNITICVQEQHLFSRLIS